MSQSDIDAALTRFHGEGGSKKPHFPRFMVATTASFGVGLTLSEVLLVGLLEPDYRVAMELQTFARHNRVGNKNKETFSFLFYNRGNELEEKIRATNAIRKKVGAGEVIE
jgi:hypothetical protein